MERDTVEYKGQKFHRYPESERRHLRVYYWANEKSGQSPTPLHRKKFKEEKDDIPKGAVIHHKDGDPLNNDIDNLEAVSKSKHQEIHMNQEDVKEKLSKILKEKAQPKAKEWHSSEEGKKWHKQQYEETKEALYKKRYEHVCEQCGEEYRSNKKNKTKYCSDSCQNKAYYEKNQEKRVCSNCGEDFETYKHSDAKTCSQKCAAENRN